MAIPELTPREHARNAINRATDNIEQIIKLPEGGQRDLDTPTALSILAAFGQLASASALLDVADAIRSTRTEQED